MKNSENTQVTTSEKQEKSMIEYLFTNTQNSNVFARINGKDRQIKELNTGEFCFISKNKIFEKTVYLGYFKKNKGFVNDEYANIFSEADQVKIKNYFN